MAKTHKYTVIRDTREQKGQGWHFTQAKDCMGTEIKKLDTGDYSLIGYEHIFTIERKGSVSEFAGNLVEARFERELERMRGLPCPFLLLEFTLADLYRWPVDCGLSKAAMSNVKTSPAFLVKKLFELQLKYPNVHILFAGDHGKQAASSIFKRIVEQNHSKTLPNC